MSQSLSINQKIQSIFKDFKETKIPKKQIILNPDEDPFYIFYLCSGYVRSYTITEDGNELTINIFKPQTFFPMITILAQRKNMYYYETMTASTLKKAPKSEVLEKILNQPEIVQDLLKRTSIGMEGILLRMQFLMRSDAKQKVASTLIMLTKRFGTQISQNQVKITLPLTHQDIANLIGSSRETVSIETKKLERKNIIIRQKKLTLIKDYEALKEEATIYEDDQPLPFAF